MSKKIHEVTLTAQERKQLDEYVKQGKKSARSITRARILLLADRRKSDEQIAEALGTSLPTVYRIRKRYHAEGLKKALKEEARSGAPAKVDARLEAYLIALCCSEPPQGHSRWTLRLLADRLVRLELVDAIDYTTVRNILKKTT